MVQCHTDAAFMRSYHEGGVTAGAVQVSPRASLMRTYREDGGTAGEVQTSPSASFMRTTHEDGVRRGAMETAPDYSQMLTYAEDGVSRGILYTNPSKAQIRVVGPDGSNRSRITANDNRITLFAAQNGQRYLEINETGIWIRTGPSSRQKSYNLEETAQDSGWVNLSYASGFGSAGSGGPFQIRRAGGIVHLRGRLARKSGKIVAGTEYAIGTLNSSWRPSYTQRTLIAGGSSSQWGRIEVSAITGEISIAAISGNMDWVDLSGTLWTVD